MARMDGESPAVACGIGDEFRDCLSPAYSDTSFRKGLLFSNLPPRNNTGHHFMDSWKDKEKEQVPFQLVTGKKPAQICRSRAFHHRIDSGSTFNSPADRSIRSIRQNPQTCWRLSTNWATISLHGLRNVPEATLSTVLMYG